MVFESAAGEALIDDALNLTFENISGGGAAGFGGFQIVGNELDVDIDSIAATTLGLLVNGTIPAGLTLEIQDTNDLGVDFAPLQTITSGTSMPVSIAIDSNSETERFFRVGAVSEVVPE